VIGLSELADSIPREVWRDPLQAYQQALGEEEKQERKGKEKWVKKGKGESFFSPFLLPFPTRSLLTGDAFLS